MSGVRIQAPAKVNLGLSILGKRADGYHEIDTILAMIDLADTITLLRVDEPGITISGMDEVPPESNLITRAIKGWCERTGDYVAFEVDVRKRIQSPAGLGGGSSDAAAVIRALDALCPGRLDGNAQHELAASLGADCPFFLGSVCARATGIGTDLESLPPPAGWLVIVVPPVIMEAKTASLFGALRPEDYGSHDQVEKVATALPTLQPELLTNSFTRAAMEAFPQMETAATALASRAGSWTLSGAGPAVFAIAPSEAEASCWVDDLRSVLPAEYAVRSTTFLSQLPQPQLLP